jgi:hypothetical protein
MGLFDILENHKTFFPSMDVNHTKAVSTKSVKQSFGNSISTSISTTKKGGGNILPPPFFKRNQPL